MAYHPVYGRLRMGPPGYYIDQQGVLIPEEEVKTQKGIPQRGISQRSECYPEITFGGGFTPTELASSGVISGIIAFLLGAGLPGALVMGIGSMVVEAGSTRIPTGWKRYALGLFRKPH